MHIILYNIFLSCFTVFLPRSNKIAHINEIFANHIQILDADEIFIL